MSNERPITGYVDPNFPNPGGPNDATIIIYGYTPSLALAIIGIALFAIAFAVHLWLLIRYRTKYFIPLLVGTAMEVVGYIFRSLSSKKDPYSVPFFVVQYFFIVIAPVFFSAAIYTIISIMIQRLGTQYAPLPPKLILWGFVTADVIATVVQVAGAALVGSAYSNRRDPTTPNNILLGGLAFQVFTFALFLICITIFLRRTRKVTSVAIKRFAGASYIAALMIYLRTCFRLAETSEGLMRKLSTHEVFFGCLEFAPVVLATYIFIYWHPGKWLHSKGVSGAEIIQPPVV